MDAKKIEAFRKRLSTEHQTLVVSINRSRLAAEEIRVEKTEDEGDLATISHDKHLLYNLQEGDFRRVRFIKEALRAMDRGQYGECARCGEDISEKRLEAVPWATVCVECQERAEQESTPSPLALIGLQDELETEPLP